MLKVKSQKDHGENSSNVKKSKVKKTMVRICKKIIPVSVQGTSLALDMTKRLRLVRNSTMVDVKVILEIYMWPIYFLTFKLYLNYPGNFNSFMSMSECENSCKDGGSSRAMCLLPRWEHSKNKDLQFSSGPRDPVRIGFQSGTLTTLRNAACLSTTEGVKVE